MFLRKKSENSHPPKIKRKNRTQDKDPKKIAIIGLGASGMTAAWSLDQQEEFEVHGFDKNDQNPDVGGHIHSVPLDLNTSLRLPGYEKKKSIPESWSVIVEGGAEFMGDEKHYPHFHRMAKHHGLQLEAYKLSIDFENRDVGKKASSSSESSDTNNSGLHLPIPPYYSYSKGVPTNRTDKAREQVGKDLSRHQPSRFFYKGPVRHMFPYGLQPYRNLDIISLITNLESLSFTQDSIESATNIKKLEEKIGISKEDLNRMTVAEFVERMNENPDKDITLLIFKCIGLDVVEYSEQVLKPLIAAGWGTEKIEHINTLLEKYAMSYLLMGETWYDAPEGLQTLYRREKADSPNTKFNLKCGIAKVEKVKTKSGNTKYKLRKEDGTYVCHKKGKQKGKPILYDHVVMSTQAGITEKLLPDSGDGELDELRECLGKVNYLDTTVVFHQDANYSSDHNTVVHTIVENGQAANTMCKAWKCPKGVLPYMKGWVLKGQPMPEHILKEVHYLHPHMDNSYEDAKEMFNQVSGHDGLWFCGINAGYNDSQDSAILSGAEVAAQLCQLENCLTANQRLQIVIPERVTEIQAQVAAQQRSSHHRRK